MTSVTVDLDDLERLVMTTGALKTVEQAMQHRKADPFVRSHLEFTQAHNRLATAMRNAQRSQSKGNTVVDFDAPLSDDEVSALKGLVTEVPQNWFHPIRAPEKAGDYFTGELSVWDRLNAKGMCVIGQVCEGAVFPGEPGPMLRPYPGFAVKITERGRSKIVEIEVQEAAVV